MSADTSRWSHDELVKDGTKARIRNKVYQAFVRAYPAGLIMPEVAEALGGIEKQTVSPVMTTLEKRGFLERMPDRVNPDSGKKNQQWRYTGRTESKIEVQKLCKCECCEGRGSVMKKMWVEPDAQKELFDLPKPKDDIYGD